MDWLGDIDTSSEIPTLDLQVAIQFVRACIGNFIESQETPFISQASEIIDGMSNAMFEELKKKGIETTPEQTYFLATLGVIRWLNINQGVMMGDMKGTCLEDFINTNSLRAWVPQMFSMGGQDYPMQPADKEEMEEGWLEDRARREVPQYPWEVNEGNKQMLNEMYGCACKAGTTQMTCWDYNSYGACCNHYYVHNSKCCPVDMGGEDHVAHPMCNDMHCGALADTTCFDNVGNPPTGGDEDKSMWGKEVPNLTGGGGRSEIKSSFTFVPVKDVESIDTKQIDSIN